MQIAAARYHASPSSVQSGSNLAHRGRPATACFAILLIAGACMAQLRATSAQKPIEVAASRAAPGPATTDNPRPYVPAGESPPAGGLVTAKPATRPVQLAISVDGYHVGSGEHFVEIRVHRNRLQKNSSFAWWTEPATAKQNVDYVNQAEAIQTFPPEQRTTRFYVKLLPGSERSQRDFFYLAIAQPGHDRTSEKVTRTQIWLPTLRDQLQARH